MRTSLPTQTTSTRESFADEFCRHAKLHQLICLIYMLQMCYTRYKLSRTVLLWWYVGYFPSLISLKSVVHLVPQQILENNVIQDSGASLCMWT